jgi:hypothetical protein
MEEMGCHMLEGLQQRCRCMGPVSEGVPAPPAGRSTLGHVGGPRSPPSQVVAERRQGAGRGDRLSKMKAAELHLVSLGYVAMDDKGHADALDSAWLAVLVAREGRVSEPRHGV